jgi:hypothetical protein
MFFYIYDGEDGWKGDDECVVLQIPCGYMDMIAFVDDSDMVYVGY